MTHYLTGREMMRAIAESKDSYNWCDAPEHARAHVFVKTLGDITPEVIAQGIERRAKALRCSVGDVDPKSVVIRVSTNDHVPIDPTSKKGAKHRVNFPAYKHFVMRDGELVEVARSHWQGSLSNGHFSNAHGRMSRELAEMFVLLVDRYSRRPNWRGYSYVDEMRQASVMHLMQIGLQFDEAKSENPFAYYTQAISNIFKRVLREEKTVTNIRDEMIMEAGFSPSFGRQLDEEFDGKAAEHAATLAPSVAKPLRGRRKHGSV